MGDEKAKGFITVCSEWAESFEVFFAYIGKKPAPGMLIDRIDNDGNYEPGNVRWATPKQSAQNRRNNTHHTHDGVTKCHQEWADELGVTKFCLHAMVKRRGFEYAYRYYVAKRNADAAISVSA